MDQACIQKYCVSGLQALDPPLFKLRTTTLFGFFYSTLLLTSFRKGKFWGGFWTHENNFSPLHLDPFARTMGTKRWTCCWTNSNMVVTRLELELRYQGKKLRGVTWKLTRSEHGFIPESSWLIAAQVIVPYLVSGLGLVSAGIVMDLIQVWKSKKKPLLNSFEREFWKRIIDGWLKVGWDF